MPTGIRNHHGRGFRPKTAPNTVSSSRSRSSQTGLCQLPPTLHLWSYYSKVRVSSVMLSAYFRRVLRTRRFLGQTLPHQPHLTHRPLFTVWARRGFCAGQYGDEAWVRPDKLAEAGHHGPRISSMRVHSKHSQSCLVSGWEPAPANRVHLFRACTGRLTSLSIRILILRERQMCGIVRVQRRRPCRLGAQATACQPALNGRCPPSSPGLPAARTQRGPDCRGFPATDGEMKQSFPEDYGLRISLTRPPQLPKDDGVIQTPLIAIVLVISCRVPLLQDWRATLIPLRAVPVLAGGHLFFLPPSALHHTLSISGGSLRSACGGRCHCRRRAWRDTLMKVSLPGRRAKSMPNAPARVIGIALVLSAVSTHLLYSRHYRTALPAIRRDPLQVRFGLWRSTRSPSPARALVAATQETEHGVAQLAFLNWVQPNFRARHRTALSVVWRADPQDRRCHGASGAPRLSGWIFCSRLLRSSPARLRPAMLHQHGSPMPLRLERTTTPRGRFEEILAKHARRRNTPQCCWLQLAPLLVRLPTTLLFRHLKL